MSAPGGDGQWGAWR